MARKKRKITRRKRKVVSSPGLVWLILVWIWLLYFFILTYAPDSPLQYLTRLTKFFFWELWNNFFFWMLILLGISLILYPPNWKEKIFLYSFISFSLFLAILSFPVLDSSDQSIILKTWWYLWFGVLKLWAILMWNNIIATKIFSIVLFLLSAFFTAWKLNLYLLIPKIEFEIKEDKKIERKTIKVPIQKKSSNKILNDDTKINEKIENNNKILVEPNIIKNVLKNKLKNKLEDKKEKSFVFKYPKDKPTFSINNLEKWDTNINIDENILLQKAQELKSKLAEFNIPVEIAWYEIWPTVIQFKIKPLQWVKVSSIEKLKKDLSLALKSTIRILAPIPWTEYVWIEMPSSNPKIVYLSELIGSNDFVSSMNKSFTNLAIWKTITWKMFFYPLEKMPHLLVAWQTWSWKSVAINDFILSLLYQNTPAELKFIMVDPKQVELWLYDWIPHLLAPIITSPEKALKALKRVVDVMNNRYKLLKDIKVRNIDEYNKKIDENHKINRIVVIVDELADLMMSWNKRDVEHNIARIAQMARAVWIHLILATQRPSVNVITGLIKANIPTRIAFGVVSQVDSRTILDRSWAEDLLWKWDLLFVSPSYKYPVRIQAPYISTVDTEKIIDEIKKRYVPSGISDEDIYDKELIDILENNRSETSYESWWDGDEELISQAIEIIQQTRKASITLLQRRLKIWFARAARLMDELEQRWIVWPQEWAKPRDILI